MTEIYESIHMRAVRAASVISNGILDLVPAQDDLDALIAYCDDLKQRAINAGDYKDKSDISSQTLEK